MGHPCFALGTLFLAPILCAASRPAGAQYLAPPAFRTPAMAELHATTRYAGFVPATTPVRVTPAALPAPEQASSRTKRRQLAIGTLAAMAVGIAAFAYYDDPAGPGRRVKGDAGYTPNANAAFAVGSFAGATLASYLAGRSDGSHGSFLATALGAGLGTIPVALAWNEPYAPFLGVIVGAPLQGLGARIGYQHTRRPAGDR
ncbi:MAG TPA: hypothetical protein VG432_16410 [Gemmatimonadaceae bacterium]|nr:hypothetical protein [Gemmatimonadaceae bacterium]